MKSTIILLFLHVILMSFNSACYSADGGVNETDSFFTEIPGFQLDFSQSVHTQNIDVVRLRHVAVNVPILAQRMGRHGVGQVNFNLFKDTVFPVAINKIDRISAGSTTIWSGKIAGLKLSRVSIAITDNIVAGTLRTGDGRFFQIGYVGNGVHVVKEIDEAKRPVEGRPLQPPVGQGTLIEPSPPSGSASDSGDIITVMVVYTTSAKNKANGKAAMESIINSSVATMNTTFANSGIIPRMRLVHTVEVAYNRGENDAIAGFHTALNDLTHKTDGYMDNIHALRDKYHADMVQLLFDNDSLGGLAWKMTRVSNLFESYAFSVVHYGFADGWAFDHELGHNMGMTHDRANSSSPGSYSYSYGYQNPSKDWHTVMAYTCLGWCPRIDYWSNPDVSYSGAATGVSVGLVNEADARTTINNNAYTIANWRVSNAAARNGGLKFLPLLLLK